MIGMFVLINFLHVSKPSIS